MNHDPNPADAANDLRTAAVGSQEPLPNTVSPIAPAPTASDDPTAPLEDVMAARATAVQQHGTAVAAPSATEEFLNTPEMQELRLRAAATQADIEEYIRQNPTSAVISAAAVGFFLGFILRR